MNAAPPPGVLHFTDDFQVSWAGPNPFDRLGFCFGSEDGRVLFTSRAGRNLIEEAYSASESREAINGVAAIGNLLVVSTRADLTFHRPFAGKGVQQTTLHCGAHDVISHRGRFVAPAGRHGLLVVNPAEGVENGIALDSAEGQREMYMYRTASCAMPEAEDSLICACRMSGVAQLVFGAGKRTLYTATYKGSDFIDVCPVGRKLVHTPRSIAAHNYSRLLNQARTHRPVSKVAFLAATRDASFAFFSEPLKQRKQRTFRFEKMTGQVYRVFESRGHLIVLTSDALHVMLDFTASLFSNSRPLTFRANYHLPVRAVDANLGSSNEVLVITEGNEVLKVELDALERSAPKGPHPRTNRQYESVAVAGNEPHWESHGMNTGTRLMTSGR